MSTIQFSEFLSPRRVSQGRKGRVLPRLSQLMALSLMLVVLALQPEASFAQDADSESVAQRLTQLDINTADAAELAAGLQGVGLVKAQEIVKYRTLYGDFIAVEELADVKCIGMATVEKNRHVIVLESDVDKDA